MDGRLKVAGHAVHPMLIPLPLGISSAHRSSTSCTSSRRPAVRDRVILQAGLAAIGGVAASRPEPSTSRTFRRHPARSVWARLCDRQRCRQGLSALSAFLRYRPDDDEPSALAPTLTFAAAALSLVTGWPGGEFIERLGVGVDSDAHHDASISLTRRAAGACS